MAFKSNVVVRTQFAGMHCWAKCPLEEVAFLKKPHRHMFHVELKLLVSHDDRDVEFFMLKQALDIVIEDLYEAPNMGIKQLGSRSCEMIAKEIISAVAEEFPSDKITCSVFEDNENGAEVTWIAD